MIQSASELIRYGLSSVPLPPLYCAHALVAEPSRATSSVMAARVRNYLFIAEFGLVYIVDVYLNEVSLHISRAKVGKKK